LLDVNLGGQAAFILASPDRAAGPFYGVCVADASESSVVQCGQRVALLGIDIAHAGQSFTTGSAFGFGRFILLIPRMTRKMQNATMRKLITNVMKFP
jgi:hypothetical protein